MGMASSFVTNALLESYNFEKEFELGYDEFTMPDGSRPFANPPPPHKYFTLWIKEGLVEYNI